MAGGLEPSLRSLPTQTILWFYDTLLTGWQEKKRSLEIWSEHNFATAAPEGKEVYMHYFGKCPIISRESHRFLWGKPVFK